MSTMDWNKQGGSGPANYDEFLVPAMFEPFAELLIAHAQVQPGAQVLDVACGTGAASRAAARAAGPEGAVTGLDLGEPTLEVARSHAAEAGAAPIAFLQSDAAALDVADAAFDVALCQQGLQFFPDRPAALAEILRALKPGGRVAIATWKHVEPLAFDAIGEALADLVDPQARQMMLSPFALGDGAQLGALLTDAGFSEVEVVQDTLECTWASHAQFAPRAIAAGPLAALFADVAPEVQRAVTEQVAERLAPYATSDGKLRMPMTSNVAVGRA